MQLRKGYTKLCNVPQRLTTTRNEPQRAKRATTTHNEPQRTTASHNKPQWVTKTHNESQRATTSHSETQRATATPQLRHKMNKTYKKLHSLVNALSPLNPSAGGILVKIVLMLVPQVSSARCHLLTPSTHTMFRHCSVCGGSIWKRFCKRNTTGLVVKGWKSKYKFAANLFSVFISFFPSLENLGRRQGQRFPYSSETF